jgi:hypothetical protein
VKRDNFLKHALIAFAITLIGYVLFYQADRWLRLRHGPWRVAFGVASNGVPAIVITEEKLGIKGARLEFPSETAALAGAPETLVFDSPLKTNLPFGRTLFLDTTYLPGAVTMNLFGHEIELLPRTLVVNRREVPWASVQTLTLDPSEKLPPDPAPKKKRRY